MEITETRKNIIKKQAIYLPIVISIFAILLALTIGFKKNVKRNNAYTKREYVALYIIKYHELPKNYITKDGRDYFYRHNVDLKGYIVGGDTHYNDGNLEYYGISKKAILKECDLYYEEYDCLNNRGTSRLVYESNTGNPRVFVTNNHYYDYQEITKYDIMPLHYSFLILLVLYLIFSSAILICIYFPYISWFIIRKKNKKDES
ncbi:MAG: hypothetical protein K6E87_00025 [bacterium]|nr:hypothetical protein [bacterium]